MKKIIFFTLVFIGTLYSGLAQMGGFGQYELLYSDATIKVEISYRIRPCTGNGESNNTCKYKYRITGSPKSTGDYFLNWKMDYVDCNGNLYYRNNALNIGSNNPHFSVYVTEFAIPIVDEDFTCKSLEKRHYDETLSSIKKSGIGLKGLNLRKATSYEITKIMYGLYGINPERRNKLIAEGIDPDDAQSRINAGEGSSKVALEKEVTLSTSVQNISAPAIGDIFTIDVNTNESFFEISNLPNWCRVNKYNGWFSLACDANYTDLSRTDWFKVAAGDKEVKINVYQAASIKTANKNTYSQSNYTTPIIVRKPRCFNCPKTKDVLGLTFAFTGDTDNDGGFQGGLIYEPLFKYGFGLRTGLLFDAFDKKKLGIVLPIHLEYRLNFAKKFSLYGYGGLGLNLIRNSNGYPLPMTFDYGAGMQINHFHIIVGDSKQISNYNRVHKSGYNLEKYEKLNITFSFMFPVTVY